jgi:hypothetical protein
MGVGINRETAWRVAPALAVLLVLVALETGRGAPLGDALLYVGYELVYVVLPGCLLFRALASRPGDGLRTLALGWALGSALEVFAFIATAALDARWLFLLYPLLVAAPAVVIIRSRSRSRSRSADGDAPADPRDRVGRRAAWAIAGVCIAAIAMIAVAAFHSTPLPGAEPFSYFRDYPWHLALVAEAKEHWPIADPQVAGEPFVYHYFVHLHMAAASQVTGIGLPTLFFRLNALPLVMLTVLLFAEAGRSVRIGVAGGLIAAALAVFVGDLQLQTDPDFVPHAPFLGVFVAFLITSPTFLFGVPFFLALLIVAGERATSSSPGRPGDLIVLGLLALGASNAKVTVLPVILAGLGFYAVWSIVRARRFPVGAAVAAAVVTAALLVMYASQYAGQSSGFAIDPFATLDLMPAVQSIRSYGDDLLGGVPLGETLVAALCFLLGIAGLLAAQLGGIAWLRRRGLGEGQARSFAWLAGLLAAGLLVLLLGKAPGMGSQLYFVFFGTAAGSLLAAAGLRAAWARRPPLRSGGTVALALAAGWVVVLLVIMRAPLDLGLGFFSGEDGGPRTLVFWYAGLAASLVLLAVLARRLLEPGRWWAGALVTAALLAIGVMGTVANYVGPKLSDPAYASPGDPTALTPEAYRALSWVRDETPEDAVIAVNDDDQFGFEYTGFSERAAFIQGWAYTRESFNRGYDRVTAGEIPLFTERRALNAAAFAGDPKALAALAGAGVDYLVVDETGNLPADGARLSRFTTPVYEGGVIDVLRLDPELSGRE